VIPAGVAHEFVNFTQSLSIAWNILPRIDVEDDSSDDDEPLAHRLDKLKKREEEREQKHSRTKFLQQRERRQLPWLLLHQSLQVPKPQFRTPEPETRNPEPETRTPNPHPQSPNPQPSDRNLKV
jgi:hypothetical protein